MINGTKLEHYRQSRYFLLKFVKWLKYFATEVEIIVQSENRLGM